MAATFVVETGTGSSTANSYSTEAAADQYHENYGDPTDWSGATTTVKENALRVATQYMDARFGTRWLGTKANETQRLDWPRCGAVVEEYTIDSDVIPEPLQDTTAVLALKHVQGTALIPDVTNAGTLSRVRVKVGPIEEEKEYAGSFGETDQTTFELAERLIASLVWPVGWAVRG
ncbi:MAG TPA: DnaT-like ssDNA-binding protein [Polyangiales bacterium]|nr:DnaT-like ssDNA-binding protein [Polyangiales bacterium]